MRYDVFFIRYDIIRYDITFSYLLDTCVGVNVRFHFNLFNIWLTLYARFVIIIYV